MAAQDLNRLREALRDVGKEKSDELLERRAQLVEEGRAAGLTWRELANLLGMTEHGLIKAQKKREQLKAAS